MQLERSLVILKPDAVARGYMGEIIARFERAGFVMVGAKMILPSKELLHKHYEDIGKLGTRKGQAVLDAVVDMMIKNPVLACVFEGVEAVENIRKLVGPTQPKAAAAGTIRGDYAQMSYAYADANSAQINNLIHASADLEEAKQEIPLWFSNEELHHYETVHSAFIQGK